jgi:hypothetical protein
VKKKHEQKNRGGQNGREASVQGLLPGRFGQNRSAARN